MTDIQALVLRAREWAAQPEGESPIPEIEAAMVDSHGFDLAELVAARASALQRDDPAQAAEDSLRAGQLFEELGRTADAAAFTAAAATFLERLGERARALELAVAATVQLSDVELDDIQAVRATSALCAFYGQMGAFDLAAPFGDRCLTLAQLHPEVPRAVLIFNYAIIALDAIHLGIDRGDDRQFHDDVRSVAALLRAAPTQPSSAALGATLQIELALLDDDLDAAEEHLRALSAAEAVSAVFEPWVTFVTALVHRGRGELDRAEAGIDRALTGLEPYHYTHVRALGERAAIREARGDVSGALDDERQRSRLATRWGAERTSQYASLIASQARLVRVESRLRSHATELARAAAEDPLTGLLTRRWLNRRAEELEAEPNDGAVLLMDLDHFKAINDTYGHGVGDEVLAAVAASLSDAFRDGDVVRYGGEEFLVPLLTDHDTALDIAERARAKIASTSFDEIVPGLRLSVSIGVASGPMRRLRDLITAADDALYQAKARGRNQVVAASAPSEEPDVSPGS